MSAPRLALAGIALICMALSGCDSFSVLGVFTRTNGLTLTVQKDTVQQGETIDLYPAGGTPPYSFGVVGEDLPYSSGTLGSVTNGQYTAGTDVGTVLIHLVDSSGFSVDSPVVILPPTPATFSAAPNPGLPANDILLSWTYSNALAISGFLIQRSPDGVAFTNLPTQFPSTNSYIDTGLSPATTYFYRLYAVSGAYQSLAMTAASTP